MYDIYIYEYIYIFLDFVEGIKHGRIHTDRPTDRPTHTYMLYNTFENCLTLWEASRAVEYIHTHTVSYKNIWGGYDQ